MTLRSGIVCAAAWNGRMPGSASAAVSRVRLDFSVVWGCRAGGALEIESGPTSVAATSASADTVAAAGTFLARIDVRRRLGVERIGIELHLALGEIALFPRLRRRECRARCECDQRDDAECACEQQAHQRGETSARMRCSSAAPLSSRKPRSMATTVPRASIRNELGIALTAYAAGVAPGGS